MGEYSEQSQSVLYAGLLTLVEVGREVHTKKLDREGSTVSHDG